MISIDHALRGALRAPAPPQPAAGLPQDTLLLGAGGPLGSAVLEALLAGRGQARIEVATVAPLAVSLRGLHELRVPNPPFVPATTSRAAVCVFDRRRFSHGREDAYWMPAPQDLVPMAQALRQAGVAHLVIVMPHAPASLPEALKQGLAGLDEQAVVAMGFERLVFVRSAQRPRGQAAASRLQQVAYWMLGQLSLMLPQAERPVRPAKVAAFVHQVLARMPEAPGTTWVARPELVWQAAQTDDVAGLVDDWLRGTGPAPGAPVTARGLGIR